MPGSNTQFMSMTTKNAHETMIRVQRFLDVLKDQSDPMLVMAENHRSALAQFLDLFQRNLKTTLNDVDLKPDDKLRDQIIATRTMELELAVRFSERCFLEPRRSNEARILETVDWLCVEGFQLLVSDGDSPPIPIVAIESSMTPAVWAPNSELPIPSIFRSIAVNQNVKVPTIPIICLPGHLVRSPELYPLLSHEVGHCVDDHKKTTETLRSSLPVDLKTKKYWDAWLREIVADAIGLALSGVSFRIALEQFLATLAPIVTISASYAYPPNALRFAFLDDLIKRISKTGSDGTSEVQRSNLVEQLGDRAGELVDDFRSVVAPALIEATLNKMENWLRDEQRVTRWVMDLATTKNDTSEQLPFRLLPSVITRVRFVQEIASDFDGMQWLNDQKDSVSKPSWVESEATWDFREDHLPTLRPTYLGADGKFKVPPLTLMATHDSIAFVGATHWQLLKGLKDAANARNAKPWDELHIFFASRDLLKMVEYGPFDSEKHRDQSKQEVLEWLTATPVASRWCIYEFDGPPVFASYWDWTRQGGRIHISPALLSTRIGECPASDHLWLFDSPSDHYQKYLKHLDRLFVIARKHATSTELKH
jgi:hypothetical protein